jgi:hypothetical protein
MGYGTSSQVTCLKKTVISFFHEIQCYNIEFDSGVIPHRVYKYKSKGRLFPLTKLGNKNEKYVSKKFEATEYCALDEPTNTRMTHGINGSKFYCFWTKCDR